MEGSGFEEERVFTFPGRGGKQWVDGQTWYEEFSGGRSSHSPVYDMGRVASLLFSFSWEDQV